MEQGLSIHQMASQCGLSTHALRYYERAGLIRAVTRASSGRRRYRLEDREWVAFLMRLRATGMSIRQMAQFAKLRAQGDATIASRRALLEQHLADLRGRIRTLEDAEQALTTKIAHYRMLEKSMTPAVRQTTRGVVHGKSIRERTRQAQGDRRSSR